ncbi:MAG TPA: FAD-dependent oxidoreductase [Candidatus Aquicultor sp.]|jgi:2,4-dienoyl-CoA reductase-like NADH-dependent reductase (Old Yellow Enzyme family)/thioredoxin reductase
MSNFPALFSTGTIDSLTTKNRLIMAPMVRNYADEHGLVTSKYAKHIERIARGGVGAMILEASYVRPDGKGFVNELSIHTDDVIPGLRQLADIAHSYGAVIGPQIFHAGRQTASAIMGVQPVAPSPIPDPTVNEVPRALSVDEIHSIVNDYAQAARRAKEAGCDFVEVHGAHGYLITQFLSPFSNARDDEYGGSLENRMRFVSEIIQAIRATVGADFPVIVRISGEEQVPTGLTLDDSVKIAQRLEELGVNAIHVSAGNYASFDRGAMISPMAIPDGPLVPLAKAIKGAVKMPVIAVGKIRTPELANDIIQTGKADFVALGRPLLADPDWPNKALEGRTSDIDKCIACNQGCITRLFGQQDVWCTVNPETSREEEFARPFPESKRKVLVIGGGPAGMEAAKYAAGRGHHVVLFEQLDHLGGQLVVAAAPPHRPGWEELRQYLGHEMNRLGIDVRLQTTATADLVQKEGADVLVVATGSSPVRPSIPGISGENVITNRDLLEGTMTAKGNVVVAGGGCSGAQTAEFLADQGHNVTIVEMLGDIAKDAAAADRDLLIARLQSKDVKTLTNTKIMKIETDKVFVEPPARSEVLPADTVALCLGQVPNNAIVGELRKIAPQVVVIGDAVEPRKVTEAMIEGARAGLTAGERGGELAA